MKPITIIWTIVCMFTTSFCFGQMPCDTAIAGITMNMSLSASCRLDIDSSSAKFLTSNYSPNMDYVLTVFDMDDTPMSLPLTSDNVGNTYKVMLQGKSCPDNIGWSYLNLEDKIAPILTCKDDTMTCVEFFFYKSQPMIECDLDTIEVIAMDFEPACDPEIDGISTIATRTYRATDKSGNSSTCTERIYIRRIEENQINFPTDLVLSCDTLADVTDAMGNLLPPSLLLGTGSGTLMSQYIFGVPTGSGASTGSGVSLFGGNFRECRTRAYYEDILTTDYTCKKVYQRLWTVYEWYCDGEEKTFPHLQTITFQDTTPPAFSFVEDTLYYDLNSSCDIEIAFSDIQLKDLSDNCTDSSDLQISYEYYPNIVGEGTDSTIYIRGVDTIRVEVTVKDNCHKSITKNMTIITRDNTDPTAICIGFMEVALSNPWDTRVSVESFNSRSYDGCGGTLTLSAQKMGETSFHTDFVTFSCDDPDTTWVVFMVTDEQGRTDQCMSSVEIKKTAVDCSTGSGTSMATISGFVSFEDKLPVANSKVALIGKTKIAVTTDQSGYYEIPDYEPGQEIMIMPEKNDHPESGITTLDIIYLQRHMLGIQDLNSAYQVIAADIDANDDINAVDLIQLRKMVIGDIEEFDNSPSYVFVPADMQFEDEMDPWINGELFGKQTTTQSGINNIDFMGIKVGDVNNSLHNPEVRNRKEVNFTYDIIEMGNYLELSIYAPHDMILEGFQTTLQYDEEALHLMKVGQAQLSLTDENYTNKYVQEGQLPISWNHYISEKINGEQAVMRFTFEKIYDADYQFTFVQNPTKSEIYMDEEIFKLGLQAKETSFMIDDFSIVQNVPNPWANETTIKFNIPTSSEVEINIYDASMRSVFRDAKHFEQGPNYFKLNYSDLPDNGIFIYEIIYGDQVRVSKMTKI